MKVAEFIFDYLKRVFACMPATLGCLIGGVILSIGFFIYGVLFSEDNLTITQFFIVSSSFAIFHGTFGPFFAFPVLALYTAPINSVLKIINKDTYVNVVVIPVILFVIAIVVLSGGKDEGMHNAGLNFYVIALHAAICSHAYWYFIKKWELTSAQMHSNKSLKDAP